jgi:hypothetical protein
MSRQLPLFPLGTVLFPGSTLNLHIFEDRYRLMIGRCLEQGTPFGVVLIRAGDEVREGRIGSRPAEPYTVGTVAQINANVKLEDGRYLLTAVGVGRFRIRSFTQHIPYLAAEVDDLPDTSSPEAEQAAQHLRSTYERYWQGVAVATGAPVEAEELPINPVELGYQLADRLQVPYTRKQRWLESSTVARLREIAADLRAELSILPTGRRTDDGGIGSLN